jgi:hypothetical protein
MVRLWRAAHQGKVQGRRNKTFARSLKYIDENGNGILCCSADCTLTVVGGCKIFCVHLERNVQGNLRLLCKRRTYCWHEVSQNNGILQVWTAIGRRTLEGHYQVWRLTSHFEIY